MAALCGDINTIVDVGASDGRWSEGVRACWPNANYLLIEAQDIHRSAHLLHMPRHGHGLSLSTPRRASTSARFTLTRATRFGGEACAAPFANHNATLPCTTIDTELEQRGLPGPYLIKLDTHGHEREILRGAERGLGNAGLVVIEAYNFAKPNRMYFWQLLRAHGREAFAPRVSPILLCPGRHAVADDLCFMPRTNVCFDRAEYDRSVGGLKPSATASTKQALKLRAKALPCSMQARRLIRPR